MSKKKAEQGTTEAELEGNIDAAEHQGQGQPGDPVSADQAAPTAEAVADEAPAEMIARLQEELEEQTDQQLRARAEAENIRRRADLDVANSRKFAIEAFAGELLAVRDSLELASAVEVEAGQDDVIVKLEEGLKLTLKQLDHVFDRFDIREVMAKPGIKPDPALHQAVSLVDSEEVDTGEIVSVMQKGYQLHDRLLRPAMVLVAK
jgi:molecular chaperone GrpE